MPSLQNFLRVSNDLISLPFLASKEAENPFFVSVSSEWNFTNIVLPVDLIVIGSSLFKLPQNLRPNNDDESHAWPSLISR